MRIIPLVLLLFVCPLRAEETGGAVFDPHAALIALELAPGDASEHDVGATAILEKLRTIAGVEKAFHRDRIEKEIIFTGQFGGRQELDAYTRDLLQMAAARQKRIRALAREIRSLLKGPARARFDRIALPDLTDPGATVYGMFRRPSSSVALSKTGGSPSDGPGEEPARTLALRFDHDTHPPVKKSCTNCHGTNNRKRIGRAFEEERTRKSERSTRWWRYRRNEHIPTMERCMACHESAEKTASCRLCHPGYDEETILSDSYNSYGWLKAGMSAPAIRLEALDGRTFDSEVPLANDFLVIQFGSSTSSPYLRQVDDTAALVAKYDGKPVTFLTIYTREAHPELIAGDAWLPASQADLATRAAVCLETLAAHGIEDRSRLVVDDWPGRVNRLYGSFPNSVFILTPDRRIAWKAAWCRIDRVDEKLGELLGGH